MIGMTEQHVPHPGRAATHVGRRTAILQLPPQDDWHHDRRARPAAASIRTLQGVELPAPGLWNIPAGWVTIQLSMRRFFGTAVRTHMRLKQGMIAIADDPTHSTVHVSLDADSLRTGHAPWDRFLHERVLDTDRFATIPVRIAAVEHVDGPNWKGCGWVTIRGVAAPIELDIAYDGVFRPGVAARFRANAALPLRSILPGNTGLRGRLLAGKHLRIAIDLHAEPVRGSIDIASRTTRSRHPSVTTGRR
jgi:polyisoprenoid-binding protein YceI